MKFNKFYITLLVLLIALTSNIINTKIHTKVNSHNSKILHKLRTVKLLPNFPMNPIDPLSYSNFNEVIQTKLLFDVEIDLEKEVIAGLVRVYFNCVQSTDKIILDIKTLEIYHVKNNLLEDLQFEYVRNTSKSRAIGRGLVIKLNKICLINTKEYVDINYSTTQKSIGVHFSHPTMLENKNNKFMYTHGPAIFARTYFPSQDTPSAKVKLEAKIRIDDPYTVLFSGLLQSVKKVKNNKLEYHFKNNLKISTYLVAFSSAILAKRDLGDLCEVYAEPELINSPKIDATFVKCSDYVNFYSKMYFKNPWGKMTFIVLPDDFPYAGMENPYGIQISKAMLTNDGMNKNVVAHEIAHFWTGNLVTAKTWGHFWLNEGMTNYIYRKAFQKIFGNKTFTREVFKSTNRLSIFIKNEKENLKKASDKSYMSLNPHIETYDPYSHFSLIPYEKGFSFLFYIESKIGEKNMQKLMQEYFKTFAFSNATTKDFVTLLKKIIFENFNPKLAQIIFDQIKWKKWVKGTGKIPITFKIKSKQVRQFKNLVKSFTESKLRVDEMVNLFNHLNTFYKNQLLGHLSRATKKMKENNIEELKNFAQYYINDKENSNMIETSTLANFYLLRAKLEKDKLTKLKICLILFRKVKFYHATFLKRIFAIFKKDLKMKTKKMIKIVSNLGYRLNKLTTFRVLQFIFKK